MNEQRRDKLAVDFLDRVKSEPDVGMSTENKMARAFVAGWNACYAELTTKRSEPEADWFGKEQTRD